MNKIITFQQINPFKKAYNALSIITKQRYLHTKQLNSIARRQALQDPVTSLDFNDSFSYSYRLFDCTKPQSIHLFHPYSDQSFGGDSKAKLYFDLQQNNLNLSGKIESKNKDKLEQHPSIGMARRHPYRIKCGPFNAIQFQIKADGHPMHLGVQLQSQIQGVLSCYGIVASRIKGVCTFQLPFVNMLVSGAEYGNRGSLGYQTPKGSQLFFDRQAYDARRVLLTENSQAIIRDINIRLLQTKTMQRKIGLLNIKLVRRAFSRRFLQDYRQPYFYLVDQDPYMINEELGISWLAKSYNEFKVIDLGDKIYKQKQNSRNNIK